MNENLYRGLLSGFFVLGLLKIGGGSEMCEYFWGVPGGVTKCDRVEGESKLAKNSVTYFMDSLFSTNESMLKSTQKTLL